MLLGFFFRKFSWDFLRYPSRYPDNFFFQRFYWRFLQKFCQINFQKILLGSLEKMYLYPEISLKIQVFFSGIPARYFIRSSSIKFFSICSKNDLYKIYMDLRKFSSGFLLDFFDKFFLWLLIPAFCPFVSLIPKRDFFRNNIL